MIMEENKPSNPSAFPNGYLKGMTLRDYFAAKAMQSYMINCAGHIASSFYGDLARYSYEIADAMLKQRKL